jgi:DNA-directed RNA polymerase specialized sigma subunit
MPNEHEDRNFEEGREKKAKKRTSQKPTDFMHAEDIGTMPGLTPFELEIKKEMAKLSTTPLNELASKEDQEAKLRAFRSDKRIINRLIKEGALTHRQALVYELYYERKLPANEVARRLGVSLITIRRLRQKIRDAFVRGFSMRKKRESTIKRAAFFRLTRIQKRVFTLYFRQGLTVKQICAKLGKGERNVERLLKRIRRKIFSA